MHFDQLRHVAEVGDDGHLQAISAKREADRIGGIVRNRERVDINIANREVLAGMNRFDADLLRVRKVRISLRVQAGNDMLRGTSADFATVGNSRSAPKQLADYGVRFEVTPRNMNLGR